MMTRIDDMQTNIAYVPYKMIDLSLITRNGKELCLLVRLTRSNTFELMALHLMHF